MVVFVSTVRQKDKRRTRMRKTLCKSQTKNGRFNHFGGSLRPVPDIKSTGDKPTTGREYQQKVGAVRAAAR